jgi:hypothetical protein
MRSIETRDEEHLDDLIDWAVMGATVANNNHHQVANRVTGTLTLNGKECRGLHLDTLLPDRATCDKALWNRSSMEEDAVSRASTKQSGLWEQRGTQYVGLTGSSGDGRQG